jgi:hypothetical protein
MSAAAKQIVADAEPVFTPVEIVQLKRLLSKLNSDFGLEQPIKSSEENYCVLRWHLAGWNLKEISVCLSLQLRNYRRIDSYSLAGSIRIF